MIKTACIQTNAKASLAESREEAEHLIRSAAGKGAGFILTPENTCRMRADRAGKFAESFVQDEHPCVSFYSALAEELSIHLCIGSLSSIRVGHDKLANRSFLFSPRGQIVSTYDKIHMFDVVLPNGDIYRESDTHQRGTKAVIANIGESMVGMTICYDVRFPALYRALAQKGAQILTIPAAFTVPTGQAHWETLLRARAIENGAYVLAPAQCGVHDGGRGTWGHSMIISPWGDILAQAENQPTFIMVDLDMDQVTKARSAIPSLRHDQEYAF